MKKDFVVVIALLVGIVAGVGGGYALGYRNGQRELAGVAITNALGRVTIANSTFRMLEQKESGKAIRLSEVMFRSAVSDAMRYSDELQHMPPMAPRMRRALAQAEADATRRNWTEAAARLRHIRSRLPGAP